MRHIDKVILFVFGIFMANCWFFHSLEFMFEKTEPTLGSLVALLLNLIVIPVIILEFPCLFVGEHISNFFHLDGVVWEIIITSIISSLLYVPIFLKWINYRARHTP